MGLKFFIGESGAGKSYQCIHALAEEAGGNPEGQYFAIVPEQFTMQTQKDLVFASPGQGILNIDVLSFQRLAYRVFEEVGGDSQVVLEDIGKMLVVQKLMQEKKGELPYLGPLGGRPGCIDEMKSLLSEFFQYDQDSEKVARMVASAPEGSLLSLKLRDVSKVYDAFGEYLFSHGLIAAEEVLDQLCEALPLSERVRGSVMLFDGFTGFTPVQLKVMKVLLSICKEIWVTVTMDIREEYGKAAVPDELFYMSHQMISSLLAISPEAAEPFFISAGEGKGRFASAPALSFLEQHIFRHSRAVYKKKCPELDAFYAGTRAQELSEVMRLIRKLVREEGYAYGNIAVITGSLEEYESLARDAFERAGIPYFLDAKHNVLMNPFVEFLRSALEMVTRDFPYESVFRYLRSGMSSITRDEVDILENYCLAKGIKGYRRWSSPFGAAYRGQSREELVKVEKIRKAFMAQVEGLYKDLSGRSHTVRDNCLALHAFCVHNHAQNKLKGLEMAFLSQGQSALGKECGQIYSLVMGLLEKLVDILGDEKVSRQEYAELLETGLQKISLGLIPASQDQVVFGDMERTRLKDVKALFFVGMNEGSIPKRAEGGGFLSELDREFLEGQGVTLAPDPKKRIAMGRYYLYLNMTKPSHHLYLSYALSSNKGEPLREATLVGEVFRLFPALSLRRVQAGEGTISTLETPQEGLSYCLARIPEGEGVLSDALFREVYGYLLREKELRQKTLSLVKAAFATRPTDVIGKTVARALYGEISPYAATRLERYCSCAYAHFLLYGLRLSERVLFEFRSMDMGNLMHGALERFSEALEAEGLTWESLSPEERDMLLDTCVEEQARSNTYEVLRSDARLAYSLERAKRLLKRTVWALTTQLSRGKFTPQSFELAFEGGRIDRLDICKEGDTVYVKVMDYKSGSTTFDLDSVYYGLQLQLTLYMDAAMQLEGERFTGCKIVPAGVYYCQIKDPIVAVEAGATLRDVEEEVLKKQKLSGLSLSEPEVLKLMDESLKSLPVTLTTKGEIRKGAMVASQEEFALLGRFVKKKMVDSVEEILGGEATASPAKLGDEVACTFCPVKEACVRDMRLPGPPDREMPPLKREEVWKKLGEAAEKGESKIAPKEQKEGGA